jgi:nucleoid DNA-binding protein
MTRRELARELSEKCGISERQARKALNAILVTIVEAFRPTGAALDWNTLEIRGFGRFTVDLRILVPFHSAILRRTVRERWSIHVRFRPGRHLREMVNGQADSTHETTFDGLERTP